MATYLRKRDRSRIPRAVRLWLILACTAATLLAPGGAAESIPVASAAAAGTSLDSLLAAALRDNPRIRAAEAAWRSAEERIPQAGALPDPTLTLMAQGAPLDRPSPTEAEMTRIGLMQMFPFPGKQGLMRKSMSAEAEMAREQLARVRLETAAELTKAYYDLYLLHASIDLMSESQATLRDMAEITRTRYEVGRGMQQDLLKANVELAVEASQLVILAQRIPAAEARINSLLDRPAQRPLGRPALGDTTFAASGLASLLERALHSQPMVRMRERAVERSEYGVSLARRTGLPDFTLGGEYMAVREMPDEWMWSLAISLPIWRASKVAPARREAQQTLASAQAERRATENEVELMVREAWTMASAARTLVHLYRASVLPQAEQALASTRASYETDRASFLDLLDSQRSLLRARLEYETALTDYLKSRAELGLAVGDPALLRIDHD